MRTLSDQRLYQKYNLPVRAAFYSVFPSSDGYRIPRRRYRVDTSLLALIMNQHRNAFHIHWRFERIANHILISYGNNGSGTSDDQTVFDSLDTTKKRLESINGKMDYSPVFNEIRIQLPAKTDYQRQNTSKVPDYGSEFSVFDITIVELLSQGVPQKHIPEILHSKNLRPSGLSSVEKRLNFIREKYSLNSTSEIVAFFKDHRLI